MPDRTNQPKAKITLEKLRKLFEFLREEEGDYAIRYSRGSSIVVLTLPDGKSLQRKTLTLIGSEFKIIGAGPDHRQARFGNVLRGTENLTHHDAPRASQN